MNTRATFPFPWKFTLERNFHFVNSTINFILLLMSILKSRTQWTNFFRRKIILLIKVILEGKIVQIGYVNSDLGQWHDELRSRWKRFRLVSKVFDRGRGETALRSHDWCWTWVNEGNLGQFDVRTVHTQVLVLERKSNVYKYRIDEIIFVRLTLLLIRFILHFLKISMKDSYECSYIGVRKLMAWTWLEEDKESFHDGATIFDWIRFQR